MHHPRLLLCAALLLACDRSSPAQGEAPKQAAAPAPAAAPADAPKTELFTSADGLVAAPRPDGAGWECVEQSAAPQPGQEATLIKCRHTDRDRFFFLMAKDYAVPADQVKPPDVLANEVFPATYQKLFQRFEVKQTTPVTVGTRTGHELQIEATHASMGEIRKRERVLTEGTHVFVVSAEGKPEVFDAEAAAIEAWFAGVRFRNLP